jgi:hypothetical protein
MMRNSLIATFLGGIAGRLGVQTYQNYDELTDVKDFIFKRRKVKLKEAFFPSDPNDTPDLSTATRIIENLGFP